MTKAGILGTGTMGPQIAAALAAAGYSVTLYNHQQTDDALSRVEHQLKWYVRKNLVTPAVMQESMKRIRTVTHLSDLADSHLVIEAVIEDLQVKQELFKQLGDLCTSAVFLATNTSSLDLQAIAKHCRLAPRVLGLHFFNPVLDTQLVEVLTTPHADEQAAGEAISLVHNLNKTPISVPESCVNRILIPMINEACLALEQGLTSADDIDRALKLGANHPIGPLALADLIGIDVVIAILETLQSKLGSKYKPASILYAMAQKGHLGRKAGQGFFSYGRLKKTISAK